MAGTDSVRAGWACPALPETMRIRGKLYGSEEAAVMVILALDVRPVPGEAPLGCSIRSQ